MKVFLSREEAGSLWSLLDASAAEEPLADVLARQIYAEYPDLPIPEGDDCQELDDAAIDSIQKQIAGEARVADVGIEISAPVVDYFKSFL